MTKLFKSSIAILFIIGLTSTGLMADDVTKVKSVIEKSYFNGAFNAQDTVAMRKGFHPDFAIFTPKGKTISKYPIDTWIKGIEKRKASPDYDKNRAKFACKIISVDVTGVCASAKIEVSKTGKKIFTDYLSLLKFEDGWKIVAKVYHRHK